MKVMGLHVLAEIHDCDRELLRDLTRLEALVKDAAGENGLIVEDSMFHQFNQDGISGTLIVPKANLTIHTWPEGRVAAIDMVAFGENVDPLASCASLVSKFNASHMTARSSKREIDVGAFALAV
jgi:S-adenosylmethionine decarboxylase